MAKQSNYHNKNQQKLTREQRDNQVLGRVFRLFLLGIVADPTTKGLGDSAQAMGYDRPRED